MKILGTYRIEYANGIVQFKNLVKHEDYLNCILPTLAKIDDLEQANKSKPTPESIELKKWLSLTFGKHWFTDASPLYGAIETGFLVLPPSQGGIHKCKITLVNV